MPNSIIFFCVILVIWLGLAIAENIALSRRHRKAQRITEEYFNTKNKEAKMENENEKKEQAEKAESKNEKKEYVSIVCGHYGGGDGGLHYFGKRF